MDETIAADEHARLMALLFGSQDRRVTNVKFFRGPAEHPSMDELCHAVREVVEDTWAHDSVRRDAPPRVNGS